MFLVFFIFTFAIGFAISKIIYEPEEPKRLNPATVPIAELVSGFEEYARLLEGGELSAEADAALKVLKTHAEQKYLPEPNIDKPTTFAADYRNNKWSDGMCFEREMEKAADDDERIIIVRHWMKTYTFTKAWQTWCIAALGSAENRNYMRQMFEGQ